MDDLKCSSFSGYATGTIAAGLTNITFTRSLVFTTSVQLKNIFLSGFCRDTVAAVQIPFINNMIVFRGNGNILGGSLIINPSYLYTPVLSISDASPSGNIEINYIENSLSLSWSTYLNVAAVNDTVSSCYWVINYYLL